MAIADRFDPPHLIICDWNGTLVEDVHRACAATNDVMAHFGQPAMDVAAFRRSFVLPLKRYFAELGVPKSLLERTELIWNRRLGVRAAAAAPGIHAFFDAAARAGVAVGVVSAADAAVVERDADQIGIRTRLDFVAGGVPDKGAALRRLVEIHGREGAVWYLGDTEYDVREAVAAGAVPIGVSWGYRPREALVAAGAAFVVDDLAQLARRAFDGANGLDRGQAPKGTEW